MQQRLVVRDGRVAPRTWRLQALLQRQTPRFDATSGRGAYVSLSVGLAVQEFTRASHIDTVWYEAIRDDGGR